MQQLKDLMSRDVKVISPDMNIGEAARAMRDGDFGMMPVGEDDRMIGTISDRDIAIRAVAEGKAPTTKVGDVMSHEVLYCFEDEELEAIAQNMAEMKVRRMPVVNRDKRLVGIISLGDLARTEDARTTGQAGSQFSEPGGEHSQTAH